MNTFPLVTVPDLSSNKRNAAEECHYDIVIKLSSKNFWYIQRIYLDVCTTVICHALSTFVRIFGVSSS